MTIPISVHTWRFFRAGGSEQVALDRAGDLRHLDQLDPKLWVALACPVEGLEIDAATLRLIDADGDGRIRQPEVLAAVRWVCGLLKDPETLMRGGDLPLDAIDEATDEGRRIAAAARTILANLGKASAPAISVADTMETARIFAGTRYNGDGVVPVESMEDPAIRALAEEIVARLGAITDRSGKPGFTRAAVERFFAECEAYDAWWRTAERQAKSLLPLGAATATAANAFTPVRDKIDDFFARGRLAAFDPRALGAVNRREEEYLALAASDLSVTAHEVAGFPLARVEVGAALPLVEGVNPAWADALAEFRTLVAGPLLGGAPERLSEGDWRRVKGALAPHVDWASRQAGSVVASLGIERVRALLAGAGRGTLLMAVADDEAKAPEMGAIAAVERLARYQRDLYVLVNNFVSFRDFYGRERPAVFQAGTLFLDGRSCDLCVRVADAGRHAALAGLAKSYLAYCECARGGERMMIAAAFTAGDADNLMVGRNGVFFDRAGRDWDATITKVIENPISIQQAFWAPYKKLVRMIEEQVARRAAAGTASADARLSATATSVAHLDAGKPELPKKIDVGTVAALGVAFGALATAFAAIAGKVMGVLTLPFWQVCLAFGGVLLLISTPSMLIAWLKLRQRNLGPILDANGWAVNGQVKMNVPFGAALTTVARLPEGAGTSFAVRYPEPPAKLPKFIAIAVGIAFALSLLNHVGVINALTGGRVGQRTGSVETHGGVP